MSKVIDALLWRKRLDEPADQLPERLDSAGRPLARGGFEFGECLLDRVEVWRVRPVDSARLRRPPQSPGARRRPCGYANCP